jgi:TPR repeat protein
MDRNLTVAAAAFAALVSLANPAVAGPFEDGTAAYKRGDYAEALRLFRPAAESGNARAQHSLCTLYYLGQGVLQDYPAAAQWCQKAADQGDAGAQLSLGLMYAVGQGVPQNKATGAAWVRKSADQGHAEAQDFLGVMYQMGIGVAQDYATAAAWFRKAADQGDATAQFHLGVAQNTGRGVPQDYALAATWFRAAADQGYGPAEETLAAMYATGKGVRHDEAQALNFYNKAASHGVIRAQTMLGTAYRAGIGGLQDFDKAMRWYRKAADQGDAAAETSIGEMYAYGEGVAKSYSEALKWIRKAADRGYDDAQYRLGVFYENGQGVPHDNAAAAMWYRKAADQGMGRAQLNLGFLRAAAHDFVQAHMWFTLAIARIERSDAKNRDIAAKSRDTIAAAMTTAQVAEAQKRAAEWRPRITYQPPVQDLSLPGAIARKRDADPDRDAHKATSSGTAFFVTPDGKALTNAHVVRGCSDVTVITGGESHPARVLALDDRNDLALLAADLHAEHSAIWRLQVRQGEDIAVYGFPLPGALASGGNVTIGIVTALAGMRDDSRFLQISAPIQPGNSGGPVLDRNGAVVGVIVSTINGLALASVTGSLPQNVNFAIKASVAAAFLDAQNVPHEDASDQSALSNPDLTAHARSFTAQVLCR